MADSEIKLTFTADGSQATGTIKKVQAGLKGIMGTVANSIRVFSRLNWVVSSIQTVIDIFRGLKEWIDRARAGAVKLVAELKNLRLSGIFDGELKSVKKLNEEFEKTNKLLAERNRLADMKTGHARSETDAQMDLDRERELAALDPASEDYSEKKAAIERKYASIGSRVTRRRAEKDLAERQTRREEEINKLEGNQRRIVLKREDIAEDIKANEAEAHSLRANKSDYAEKIKADIAERVKKLREADAQLEKSYADAAERISVLREEIKIDATGGKTAAIADEARQSAIEREGREAEAEKAAKEQEKRERERKEAEAAAKRYMAEEEKAKVAHIAELKSARDRVAAVQNGVSSNRLTAMGLGSGVVPRQRQIIDEMKNIAKLLKEEITATKANKPPASADSTFAR